MKIGEIFVNIAPPRRVPDDHVKTTLLEHLWEGGLPVERVYLASGLIVFTV